MAARAIISRTQSAKRPTSKGSAKPVRRKASVAPSNDAVAPFLQAKLTVNAPNDAYEQEADSVAARIIQMPENERKFRPGPAPAGGSTGPVQRVEDDEAQAAPLQREKDEEEEELQTSRIQRAGMDEEEEAVQAAPLQRAEMDDAEEEAQAKPLQRDEDEEDEVQAKPMAARGRRQMNARFESRLRHLKSTGGTQMEPSLQHFMESRFGRSFGHVRIHTNADAAHLARDARARAFTVGRDIVFNRTEYRPDTDSGRRLVAHELTHVLQQKGGLHSVQREIFSPETNSQTSSPRREELLARLERVIGLTGGQLPAAIHAVVSDILRTAATGPDAEDLRGLLAENAIAAETRRLIQTTEYALRLTVRRTDQGARTELELTRAGENDPLFRHLEDSGARLSVPVGGVDERQLSVVTPLPPRYSSDPAVNPNPTQSPASQSDPQTSTPPSRTVTPASGPDTSVLNAADNASAQSKSTATGAGRGDGAGSDAPQTLRAPVDQDTEEQISEETAPAEAEIKRSPTAAAPTQVDPGAEQLVRSVLSEPGAPLPAPVASDMAQVLEADMSVARVHDGPKAARAARSLGARAFALGDRIVFGQGQYAPATRHGRALLAHELTHVRQNREGRGATFAKRDEECPPPEPVPEVEVVPSPEGPQQDPAFTGMEERTENRAANQATHGSGEGKSDAANAAAEVTEGEHRTHGQAGQVGSMETEAANPPAFDRAAFIASVLAEVQRIAPDTLNDVMEFESRGTAGLVQSAVESEAGTAASDTQSPLNQAATADPGPGQSPRSQQELAVEEPGPQPGSVRADRAMPPPRTESEVDLRSDTMRAENILREACITRPFMDEHGDPELTGAAAAQDNLAEATQQAPESYREQESNALQNAQGSASAQGRGGVQDLFESRSGNFADVGNAQGQTAVENARKRQAVSNEVNTIFTETQTAVTDRLDTVTTDAGTTFDTEAGAAVTKFESFIRENAERFENNWFEDLLDVVTDILFDPPPREVMEFYANGRRQFITDMEAAIGSVADIVETGLREAKELVVDGKRRVDEKLSGLGDDLADFRSTIADQMNERFSGLEGDINSRQGDLVNGLAQRYKRSLEQVRDIEAQVRDEYTTWVDSARETFNAAVDFVTGWIERLTSIVGGAATRIIREPGKFLSNLGQGIMQGLGMFKDNIGDNIQGAVVTWLTGNLGSAGIQLPRSFDAKGLIGFAIELVGLGLTNIKNIARRVFGRTVVAAIEAGVAGAEHIKQLFDILAAEGPSGLYDHLRGEFERIKGELMEEIGKALAQSLIVAGIRKVLGIISGLVSGGVGAVITIVTTIIDMVLWFRDNAAQLAELISTIASMAMAVLNGNVSALANGINNVLKRLLPIALSFVGALVGIGGVVRKIQQIFRAIRRPATRAITALFRRLKRGISRVMARLRRRGGRGRRGRGRGRGRSMSPRTVLRRILTAMRRPARQSDPTRALSEIRQRANGLRRQYQPRLQRGNIRITFRDTQPQQVLSDGDIDFTVAVNPSSTSATPVNVTMQGKFRTQIDASHHAAKDDINTSIGRIPRSSSNIRRWATVQTRIANINPAKKFLSKPVLASHNFGRSLMGTVRTGANQADDGNTVTDGQFRHILGKVNLGMGPYVRAKSRLKQQVFTRINRRPVIITAVKNAVKNDRDLSGTGATVIISEPPILSDGRISGPELTAAWRGFRLKMATFRAAARAGLLRYSPGTETVRIAELQAEYRRIVEARQSSAGTLPSNFAELDADHPVDLIVGGAPDQNLRMLHSGVNRSVGASLRTGAEAAGLNAGDKIRSIEVR